MCLKRACTYDTSLSPPEESPDSSEPSRGLNSETPASFLSSEEGIKAAIMRRFSETTPEEVATGYYRSIQTWFPIISFLELCARLPGTWEQASTDMCLLFMSMSLLRQVPETQIMDGNCRLPKALESSYLSLKSWIAILEGRGMNSLDFLHAKALLVLFEVVHGIFPAAYITIGALFRAADALHIYNSGQTNDYSETWRGILILDRCIAIDKKHYPSISSYRTFTILQTNPSPPESPSPTPFAFSRLFEASDILSAIHKAEKPDGSFILSDIPHPATLDSFKKTLEEEVPHELKVYSGSWAIFNTALLLLHEKDRPGDVRDSDVLIPRILSRAYREEMLSDIANAVRPFVEEDSVLNFELFLPPFVTYLTYKCATILTARLQIGNMTLPSIKMLKLMRSFLKLVSGRWLIAAYFLRMIDEDTTPRMAKALSETK